MNLLLLTAEEAADPTVTITGPRARHVHAVLRAKVGDTIRVGQLDGPVGEGRVQAVARDAVTLTCTLEESPPPRSEDTLLLAVPRPTVLGRCLAHAASLGFGRIVLFRSWRVDKSLLGAGAMAPDAITARLVEGLAQARRTYRPTVHRFDRFKPFVEDHLDELVPPGQRFVGHPAGAATAGPPARDLADLTLDSRAPFSLAIGPEGGFLDYEVAALAARGFASVHAGPHPLRVETALGVLTGQLALLRAQARARPAARDAER